MTRANFPHRRLARQESAKARQAESDKLTTQQKLDKLTARGVTSGKEFNKLQAKLQQN